VDFEARVLCRARTGQPGAGTSAAEVLDTPLVVVTAVGTVVVPPLT
jgi:3-aminobutyryl-CoA ammonia-lyase